MGDFKEQFDIRKLDSRQLGEVAYILASPAYADTLKPYILTIRDNLNTLMLDRRQVRKDELPDDFLAGGISMADGFLKFFEIIIHETSTEQILESMAAMTPDLEYARRSAAGMMKPVVGLDLEVLPDKYDPAEDY